MSAGRVVKSLRSLGILEGDELPIARELEPDRPRPALGPYPFAHRTLAEVDAEASGT